MIAVKILFVAAILCPPHAARAAEPAAQPQITFEPGEVGPGDIMIVTVKSPSGPVEGKFGDRKIYFNPSRDSYKAIVGIDLSTGPGTYEFSVAVNGSLFSRPVNVVKKEYPLQRLTLPEDMVILSPENEARAEREQKQVAAIWPAETGRDWSGDFINPREGRISTPFGMRRIINDIPKSPHTGVDVACHEGDKVRAPNNGVVVLVENMFFSGNSIFLDHGQGIYTMFFHLSKFLVAPGQQVKKGDVIGLVGSTGRSTGPHLHWGVRIQGARVDPQELIKLRLE